ncbi:MAG: hypothetical protein DMG02_10250 [Acidobacteria bacterium]|nr:MAG: hypothetical protein DMG02_10250 [Acidobacteriota bacterium]
MTVVDDRPKTLIKLNAIDAAVLLVLVVMIPITYAAYLLFRTPPARLLSVTPSEIVQGTTPRLLISGANLRPFMRVSLNDTQAKNFMIASVNGAEADLPSTLAPGTYDVVLYDYAQEVSRLRRVVTVVPASPTPSLELIVGGVFVGLDAAGVRRVKPGLKLPQGEAMASDTHMAEVLTVGTPRSASMRIRVGDAIIAAPVADRLLVPATLRVQCWTESNPDGTLRCIVPNVPQPVALIPDAYLTFRTPDQWYAFQISEAHGEREPPIANARARFMASRDIVPHVRAGDVDVTVAGYSPETAPRIVAVGPVASGAAGSDSASVELTLRLPVEPVARGWTYRGRPLKAGLAISFETDAYVISGTVLDYSVSTPSVR